MRAIAIVTSIHPDFDSRVWNHARAVAALGWHVHLVCPWKLPDNSVVDGVHLHTFTPEPRRLLRPFRLPGRVARKLFPLLRRVDLVHFHDIDILPYMALLALFKPVVYDVHENYAEEMLVREWIPGVLRRPMSHAVKWSQFLLAHLIRNFVFVVPEQADQFPRRRVQTLVVWNFASRALLQGVDHDYNSRPDAVIFTGSGYETNGSLLLLDIAERAKNVCPGVKFLVPDRFVSSAFRKRFWQDLRRRGLTDQVTVFPPVLSSKMTDWLNRATIAISPTLRVPRHLKGVPRKLYEYMAAGLPIVSSDLPFATRLLTENGAGLLAKPEDPASFVDAIRSLVEDRAWARQLGRAGQRAFAEKYSWESQMPTLLAFYERILNGRSAARSPESEIAGPTHKDHSATCLQARPSWSREERARSATPC